MAKDAITAIDNIGLIPDDDDKKNAIIAILTQANIPVDGIDDLAQLETILDGYKKTLNDKSG